MKLISKNFAESIINFLLNILIFIFSIILLISIYIGVQTKVLGNDYNNFFGYSIFEVQTGSMADAINIGDWVIVKLTKNIKLNDVVTYEFKGEYITHRIIEVYKGTYITKGDANNAKDEPVDQNQIVGKVINILGGFGILRKTLFNPSVLIALIITLFLINLAFKKNKIESSKNKLNKGESIYLFFDNVIKKVKIYFNKIIKSNKKINKKDPVISNEKISQVKVIKESTTSNEDGHYKDEDELSKTSLFRMIPVDSNEVDDKFKEVPQKNIEECYTDENELDKTSLFRMVPVDASEINDTLLEVAENEIKESKQDNSNKDKELDVEQKQEKIEVEDNTLTDINLDLLKDGKRKKGKNIIDTSMIIKKEELNELIDILIEDNDHSKIKDMFITTYIDAKYYNCYNDNSNKNSRIEKAIKEVALGSLLISDSNDTKYSDIVDMYANAFILIANLEQGRDSITDSKAKNEFYKKEIVKHFKDWDNDKVKNIIDETIKIQKKYVDILEYLLKKLETNMFVLNFNKLSTKKDMYGLELEHNISFSKVYSDYIIDKTYTEGIVAEDKLSVLFTLLSGQLIKDMISSDFDKKYILYVSRSLYIKEKKFEKLLKMIDDKYAKDNVIILITFEDLLSNNEFVKKIRKMGYKFALIFNEEDVVEEKNRGDMYIVDYIFLNKKASNTKNILSYVPEELLNKIIYEDIINKVGDFGSV